MNGLDKLLLRRVTLGEVWEPTELIEPTVKRPAVID
jgi:hypothetical protein